METHQKEGYEYYERCLIGYRENGLPIFSKDPTLTAEELKLAKRIWNAEYHKIYNRNKGSAEGETYAQKYYRENKEKVREMNKSYRERHPEKFKKYKQETYQRHRERYLNNAKRYYENNREKVKARNRARYTPNGKPVGRPKKKEGKEGMDILEMFASARKEVEMRRGYPGSNIRENRAVRRKALRLRRR